MTWQCIWAVVFVLILHNCQQKIVERLEFDKFYHFKLNLILDYYWWSISFHFIRPCGVVGRHPCYSRTFNIRAPLHVISPSGPALDTSWGYTYKYWGLKYLFCVAISRAVWYEYATIFTILSGIWLLVTWCNARGDTLYEVLCYVSVLTCLTKGRDTS